MRCGELRAFAHRPATAGILCSIEYTDLHSCDFPNACSSSVYVYVYVYVSLYVYVMLIVMMCDDL